MAGFDESVENFETSLNEKLAKMSMKHQSELDELLRLKKSYKRLMKRTDINYEERKSSEKYELKNADLGFSEI